MYKKDPYTIFVDYIFKIFNIIHDQIGLQFMYEQKMFTSLDMYFNWFEVL